MTKRLSGCLLLALLLAGCSGGSKAPAPVVSPVPTESREQVVLYFPHRTRAVLVKEVREVVRKGDQPEALALQELLKGPQLPDARRVVTAADNPNLLQPKVFDGNTVLFLSQESFERLSQAGDMLAVYAVVNTLASGTRVKSVQFLTNNHGPLMVGNLDISQPISPRWDLVVK